MGWIQVKAFREHLRRYAMRTGKTQIQIAQDLGTTYATLRFWLSGTRSPKRASLQRAAALFETSVTNFMDDPGGAIEGEEASGLSEIQRFRAKVILGDMKAEDLTDQDWQIIFEDYIHARDRMRAIKSAKPDL